MIRRIVASTLPRQSAMPAMCWSICSEGLRLQDADLVAERVAQAAVDPVAVVGRRLRELDALGAEPLVGAEAVVGAEHHDDPGGALRNELPNLLGGLLVHDRRARDVEHDLGERLAGDADGEPAEAAAGEIGLDLQAELPDVEVERLLVIEDPDVCGGDRVEVFHGAYFTAPLGRPASPKLLGRAHAMVKQVGTAPGAGALLRR
jgi:hypothetical protein